MGFRRVTFERQICFFKASKNPIPKRRNLLAKRPCLEAKKALFERPFKLDRVSFSTPESSLRLCRLGPERPKMSPALEQPRLAPVQPWGCPRARDNFWNSPALARKHYLLLPLDFQGNPGIRALYQAIGIPSLNRSAIPSERFVRSLWRVHLVHIFIFLLMFRLILISLHQI